MDHAWWQWGHPRHVSLASVRHTALSTCKGGCVPDILEKRVKPRARRGGREDEARLRWSRRRTSRLRRSGHRGVSGGAPPPVADGDCASQPTGSIRSAAGTHLSLSRHVASPAFGNIATRVALRRDPELTQVLVWRPPLASARLHFCWLQLQGLRE